MHISKHLIIMNTNTALYQNSSALLSNMHFILYNRHKSVPSYFFKAPCKNFIASQLR